MAAVASRQADAGEIINGVDVAGKDLVVLTMPASLVERVAWETLAEIGEAETVAEAVI